MPSQPTDRLGAIPDGMAALLTKGAYQHLVDAIRASKPIPGKNLKGRQTNDGIVLDALDAGSAAPCQWDGEVGENEDGTIFKFTGAGVLQPCGLPTNMFQDGALLSLAISTDPCYIILTVMTGGNVATSCEISASPTPADPIGIQEAVAPATFKLNLWVITNGQAIRVAPCGMLQAEAYIALQTDKEDPECGGNPLVNHYSWRVITSS